MAKRRTRKRDSDLRPVHIVLIIVALIAVVVFDRYRAVSEGVLLGAGIGVIAGGALGYRRGKANGTVIKATPQTPQVTGTKTRKPARVTYTGRDPNAILADMNNWSSACLDGRCEECSGKFEGQACTHCNHPGARKVPGTDPDLEINRDDTPPF